MLHPNETPRQPYITEQLAGKNSEIDGPVIAASDYQKAYTEQLRAFIPGDFYTLGTDGFGRSDTRAKLRDFFEVDRRYITYSALYALYQQEKVKADVLAEAISALGIDVDKIDPVQL